MVNTMIEIVCAIEKRDTYFRVTNPGSPSTKSAGAKALHILFIYLVYFQSPPLECKFNEG